MGSIQTVGVLIFDGIERLDFEGPLGVLGWAARHSGVPIQTVRISKDGQPVSDHLAGTIIEADVSLAQAEGYDLLLVPGGDTRQFAEDAELIAGVAKIGANSRLVASVCTGAFLVAGSGIVNGRSIATHWMSHPRFARMFPDINLVKDKRFVRDAALWSSAGISAGIDMTLNLVAVEYGDKISQICQGYLEYFPEAPWTVAEVQAALGL